MAALTPLLGYVIAEGDGLQAHYEDGKLNKKNSALVRAAQHWLLRHEDEILGQPNVIGGQTLFTGLSEGDPDFKCIFDRDPDAPSELKWEIAERGRSFAIIVPSLNNFLSPKWSEMIFRACNRAEYDIRK